MADFSISIPMQGVVESLNISAACAVSLFEAMRQRRDAGAYEATRLTADQFETLLDDWLRR